MEIKVSKKNIVIKFKNIFLFIFSGNKLEYFPPWRKKSTKVFLLLLEPRT